ncbi:apolipoprotein N-acyltransferase [Spongiibacter sp. KMU-158]|uniref:Apolipoprotein N-acyltransferase n=1 Tax=Spongiibacter pelagi TaxID=2760804 RepID=A0A927C3D3_9GAMM|nr:apolipoprotein N-acyltransferase [Spongiibacter pelagi]MBD2858730.1 apolipoprotein N-acyltransferase [Spongiibacter pelagi]
MNRLLALLCGAITPLALAPLDWWPLGIVAMAGLAISLRNATAKEAFFRAWLFGFASFATGVSWVFVAMNHFGQVSAPLAIIMTGLFCAGIGLFTGIFGYVYARLIRGQAGIDLLGFAACWMLAEWLRSWVLTGFPWLYLGYGHLNSPLAGWAPVIGVHGLNFIIALCGAALANSLLPQNDGSTKLNRLAPVLACAGLFILGSSLNRIEWTEQSSKSALTIGGVQGNIPQDQKWNYDNYWATLELYDKASEALWPEVDVVIWPEAAIPALYHHAQPFFDYMRERAEANNDALITGVPVKENGIMHNAAMVVSGGEGIYHKQRLVPFGEYVPLGSLIRGLIPFFDLPLSSFSLGAPDQLPLTVKGWQWAPSICYEIVYPDLVANGAKQADILFTISNDAWFGHSLGPDQHMQMAQMRALENGRELIRVTGSGITATVDYRGRILQSIPAFTKDNLIAEVHARSGHTPFTQYGSNPVLLFGGLLFGLRLLAARR